MSEFGCERPRLGLAQTVNLTRREGDNSEHERSCIQPANAGVIYKAVSRCRQRWVEGKSKVTE